MKITIAKDGVKRSIAGPFDVCLSREDAEAIVESLQRRLAESGWSYGWHRIRGKEPMVGGPPDTPPEPWA